MAANRVATSSAETAVRLASAFYSNTPDSVSILYRDLRSFLLGQQTSWQLAQDSLSFSSMK